MAMVTGRTDNPSSDSLLGPVSGVPAAAVGEWLVLLDELVAVLPRAPVCAGDPEGWWQSGSLSVAVAEAVAKCASCPVRKACASYAVAAGERYGVRGGTTPEER